MKNHTLLFFAFLVLSSATFAQVNIEMIVFCNDGEKFTLILDGQRYNDVPASRVKVTGLNKYRYESKVIFENRKLKDTENPVIFYVNNHEFSFALNRHGRKYKMDFVSSRWLEGYDPKISEEDNTTSSNTNTTTNTSTNTTTTTQTGNYPGNSNSSSVSVNAGPVKIGVNENGGINLGSKEGNVNINTGNKSGNVSLGQGPNSINLNKVAKTGCPTPMSYQQFETLKKNVEAQSTDESKLIAAEALMTSNCFSVNQVKELMHGVSRDEVKLDLAKKAYYYTNDLSNYGRLKEELSEEAKKKELHEFIKAQK